MYHFYAQTKKGTKNQKNDDCFLINGFTVQNGSYKAQSNKKFFVIGVADGLGSATSGDLAARYLLEQISKHKNQLTHALILNIINNAHAYLGKEFEFKALTVFTIVMSNDEFITIYHLGDTRAYKLTKRNFVQLTNDHTYVQNLIDSGAIGESMRYSHPKKHIITQSLGGKNEIHIDTYRNVFEPGEKLILTSDGIHDYLKKEEMEIILRKSDNIEKNVNALINKAIINGSNDDLTALAVRYM
jgi:serine/threonine protein phosphatase PrpC